MSIVADKVIAVCEQQSGKEAFRDSKLIEDLELDSFDRIELAMNLEETFGIELPDDEVDDPALCTVGALVDRVQAKLDAKVPLGSQAKPDCGCGAQR